MGYKSKNWVSKESTGCKRLKYLLINITAQRSAVIINVMTKKYEKPDWASSYRSLMSPAVFIYVVGFFSISFNNYWSFWIFYLQLQLLLGFSPLFVIWCFSLLPLVTLAVYLTCSLRHSTLAISFTSFLFIRKTFSSLFTIESNRSDAM